MSHASTPAPVPERTGAAPSYLEMQRTPEFTDLRARFRKFVFPWTAFFVVWYFLYVILAAYAPGFMATKLVGNINVGLVLGLLQFVTTFGITILYVRWADRVFDPAAESIRERMVGGSASRRGEDVR